MYWPAVYNDFVQLRKQLYKLKKTKSIDRYSKIEQNQKKYKTFRNFCDSVQEVFSRLYRDEPRDKTYQEVFDELLDLSQKKQLKKTIYF